MDLFRIIITLVLILVLIKRKIQVGPTLFIASAFLNIIYWLPPLITGSPLFKTPGSSLWDVFRIGFIGEYPKFRTIYILTAILLVLMLGAAMGEKGFLKKIARCIESIFGDPRWVLGGLPAMIGLLPMPGGALFTAPMVNETAEPLGLSANMRTYLNHHFRHIFEYTWVLYPGLIVLSEIVEIDIRTIAIYNIPLTVAGLVGGILFGMLGIKFSKTMKVTGGGFIDIVDALWPILFIVALVILFSLDLLICLFLLLLLLLSRVQPWIGFTFAIIINGILVLAFNTGENIDPTTMYAGEGIDHTALYAGNGLIAFVLLALALIRPLYPVAEFFSFLKRAIKPYMVVMVFGVMLFSAVIEGSGAAKGVAVDINAIGLPPIIIICLLPAIIGYLTGLTVSYVAVSFPILLPLFPESRELWMPYISLAYACGFIGVLISPVHFCLVLTVEYYKSDLMGVTRLLLPGLVVVFLTALVRYLLSV